MKKILENEMMSLQRERDGLSQEVEGGREERENMRREVEATRAELNRAENEVERSVHYYKYVDSSIPSGKLKCLVAICVAVTPVLVKTFILGRTLFFLFS